MKKLVILLILYTILAATSFAHGHGRGHHSRGWGSHGHYHGNVWCEIKH